MSNPRVQTETGRKPRHAPPAPGKAVRFTEIVSANPGIDFVGRVEQSDLDMLAAKAQCWFPRSS